MYLRETVILSTSQTPYSGHSAKQTDQWSWPAWSTGSGERDDSAGCPSWWTSGGICKISGAQGQKGWLPTQPDKARYEPASISHNTTPEHCGSFLYQMTFDEVNLPIGKIPKHSCDKSHILINTINTCFKKFKLEKNSGFIKNIKRRHLFFLIKLIVFNFN